MAAPFFIQLANCRILRIFDSQGLEFSASVLPDLNRSDDIAMFVEINRSGSTFIINGLALFYQRKGFFELTGNDDLSGRIGNGPHVIPDIRGSQGQSLDLGSVSRQADDGGAIISIGDKWLGRQPPKFSLIKLINFSNGLPPTVPGAVPF